MIRPVVRVVCACVVREGRVFAARRGPTMEHVGTWEFPGGKVEPGESDEVALHRELVDELGWDVHVGAWVGEGTTGHVHLVGYRCVATSDPTLNEHDDSRWMLPNEFAHVRWAPADGPILSAIARTIGGGGRS